MVDFLVARYGDFVLYSPPIKPSTYVLWFGPLALGLLGAVVLLRTIRAKGKEPEEAITEAEQARIAALAGRDGEAPGGAVMMVFWILAGGLATLALAFVLVPLLRRDTGGADPDANALNLDVFRQQLQELDADLALGKLDQAQHEAARHDLERELVHDLAPAATDTATKAGPTGRWAAALLTLAIPVAAVTLYMAIGDQGIIAKLEAAPGAPSAQTGNAAGHSAATMPDGSPMPSLDVLADQLAARLEQKPDNVTGWLMLARTRLTLGQQDKAMAALDRALQVAPRDPTVLLTYAEAVGRVQRTTVQRKARRDVGHPFGGRTKQPQRSLATRHGGLPDRRFPWGPGPLGTSPAPAGTREPGCHRDCRPD